MKYRQFVDLHQHEKSPLLLCNVWDVASARAAEKTGYQAIGTSSAAIATMLGYEDGQQMSFEEFVYIVKRIVTCSDLPLTVDIEAGFSADPKVTAAHIQSLIDAGVVGVNIEDSLVEMSHANNGKIERIRSLTNAKQLANFLTGVNEELANLAVEVFINVRTDAFLLNQPDALKETITRIKLYEAAGANGAFVPCITKMRDIESVVNATKLPVNVLCMPELPHFSMLDSCGIKRISMGNFLFDKLQGDLGVYIGDIKQQQSFDRVF